MIKKIKLKLKKFRQALIGILGGVLLTASLGAIDPSQMTEINVIGERAIYHFDCNGTEVISFDTAEDFNERFIETVKRGEKEKWPQMRGCTYFRGERSTLFDTQDGYIHDNEFAENIEVHNGVTSTRVYFMLPDAGFENYSKADFDILRTAPKP